MQAGSSALPIPFLLETFPRRSTQGKASTPVFSEPLPLVQTLCTLLPMRSEALRLLHLGLGPPDYKKPSVTGAAFPRGPMLLFPLL